MAEVQEIVQNNPPPKVDLGGAPEPLSAPTLNDALEKAFKIKANPFDEPQTKSNEKEVEPVEENQDQAEKQPAEAPKDVPQRDKGDNRPKEKAKVDLPDPDKVSDGKFNGNKAKQEGWEALRSNYKTAHRLASEREQEIVKLKKEIAEKVTGSTKEAETLKSQIAELNKYRAMVDIQADPDFMSKYDQPIEKGQKAITDMLLSMQISQETINSLDFKNPTHMQHVLNAVGEHRDRFTAKKLERKIEEVMDLNDKRNETLAEQKTNYQKHLEDRKKENFSKTAEEEGRTLGHLDKIVAARDAEQKPMFAFLNKQDIPEGANQSQIQQIESHNSLVDVMTDKVKEAINLKKPEDRAELAVAAVASHYLSAQLKQAQERIKSLENEVKKISNVTDETPKSKPRSSSNGQFKSSSDMNGADALSAFMASRR